MIQIIKSFEECREFVSGIPLDSDPTVENEEELRRSLTRAMEEPDRHCVLGVYGEKGLTGLFSFLVILEEGYMELLVGLSRERNAYLEAFQYLEEHYPGYRGDFVFNPANALLKEQLELRQARFEPEQQKMVLQGPVVPMDTTGIELFSPRYEEQYCRIHNKDMYWTGEMVLRAPERFRTLLAIHQGKVVGYLDVTYPFPENEPYDLLVLEPYRRRGYGRKLLAKALELNRPKGMMLLVDVDNTTAISLYRSMGFVTAQGQNTLTAHWTVPDGGSLEK